MSPLTHIDVLRNSAKQVREVVRRNIEGVTQDESLVQPKPAGNCMNWVLGHLVTIYQHALTLVGQQPVLPADTLKRYDRGSRPIVDVAQALPFTKLADAWTETCARLDAGIATLTDERLAEKIPNSPTGNPDETVHTMLLTLLSHQSYHSGQLGILRRIAGKEGAIK